MTNTGAYCLERNETRVSTPVETNIEPLVLPREWRIERKAAKEPLRNAELPSTYPYGRE